MDNNPSKTILLFLVLSITSLAYGVGAVTPALADMAKAFPEKSPETIQMIATMPQLMIMATTLLCGQLSRRLRKKTLVLAGMVLYGFGGILPAFFGGIHFILIMRGVFGAGCGFLIPLSQGLIADFFQKRDQEIFMGYRSSTAAIFGMFFTMAGGSLCAIHWRYTFFTYLFVIPVFFLILLKMPEPERQKMSSASDKGALTPAMWFFVAMYFLYNVTMMCFITNAAFVMAASKVGNAEDDWDYYGTPVHRRDCRGVSARVGNKSNQRFYAGFRPRISGACFRDIEFCQYGPDVRHRLRNLGIRLRNLQSGDCAQSNRKRPQIRRHPGFGNPYLCHGDWAIHFSQGLSIRQRLDRTGRSAGFLDCRCRMLCGRFFGFIRSRVHAFTVSRVFENPFTRKPVNGFLAFFVRNLLYNATSILRQNISIDHL